MASWKYIGDYLDYKELLPQLQRDGWRESLWTTDVHDAGNAARLSPYPTKILEMYSAVNQLTYVLLEQTDMKKSDLIRRQQSRMKRARKIEVNTKQEKEHIFAGIGDHAGLRGHDLDRFIKFSMIWWGDKSFDPLYVSEWAERFRARREYMMADNERCNILEKVDGRNGARSRFYDQLIHYGGWKHEKALVEADKWFPRSYTRKIKPSQKSKIKPSQKSKIKPKQKITRQVKRK